MGKLSIALITAFSLNVLDPIVTVETALPGIVNAWDSLPDLNTITAYKAYTSSWANDLGVEYLGTSS